MAKKFQIVVVEIKNWTAVRAIVREPNNRRKVFTGSACTTVLQPDAVHMYTKITGPEQATQMFTQEA